jgi:phospholipid/cholesterol/gamma-HCH transport system ATP-binding protein
VTHDMGTAFSVSNRIAMLGQRESDRLRGNSKDDFRKTTDPYVRDFIEGRAPESEDVDSLLSSS